MARLHWSSVELWQTTYSAHGGYLRRHTGSLRERRIGRERARAALGKIFGEVTRGASLAVTLLKLATRGAAG